MHLTKKSFYMRTQSSFEKILGDSSKPKCWICCSQWRYP